MYNWKTIKLLRGYDKKEMIGNAAVFNENVSDVCKGVWIRRARFLRRRLNLNCKFLSRNCFYGESPVIFCVSRLVYVPTTATEHCEHELNTWRLACQDSWMFLANKHFSAALACSELELYTMFHILRQRIVYSNITYKTLRQSVSILNGYQR